MEATLRRADPALIDQLLQHGYRFDFHEAVRLVSLLAGKRQGVGGVSPAVEPVRFQAHLSTAFPPSAIHSVEHGTDSLFRMVVAFMGLTGPLGVLPIHYTEWLIAQRYEGDEALGEFLDLFNHRWIALFHKAWEKPRFYIPYERSGAADSSSHEFTHYLFDLMGLGTAGLRGRTKVKDEALLFYAGLIAQRPHSASALRGILRDYFAVPVEIEQFRGGWYAIQQENLSHLEGEGISCQLGCGAIAGDAVWNQQAGLRIRVGPLEFERFQSFLPGTDAFEKLLELVRFFVGKTQRVDVVVVLKAEDAKAVVLSDDEDASRLGWFGWLNADEIRSDLTDSVFSERDLVA